MITQEYLKSILNYNPDTGVFTWKARTAHTSPINIGDAAGNIHKSSGYIRIAINKKLYRAHRLAWLYVYGEFPTEQIDHINHDRADNRIANLRVVSHQDNQKNKSQHKNNTSGYVGVHWHKKRNKWIVNIGLKNKLIHIGYFIDIEKAVIARQQAEIQYGFHENHGF